MAYTPVSPQRSGAFPVLQSLLSTRALVEEVLVDYDIGSGVECRLLVHNLNDTYVVSTDAGRYILRVYQAPRASGRSWRTEADVHYELDLLLHLKRKGFAVSTPLARRDGTLLRVLPAPEGPRPAVLFTYIDGEPVTPPRQHASLSRLYGRSVAEMHAASNDFASPHARLRLDLDFLLDIPLRTMQPLLTQRADDWTFLQGLAESVRDHLPAQGLEQGVCHGDAQGGNACLSAEGTLTFFDFDVCGYGWRAYDLAVFRWGAALGKSRLGWHDEQIAQVWTAYLAGYQERRTLAAPELKAIPWFVVARHFWFLGLTAANWDYWGLHEVDDDFWERELAFLREWEARELQ